MKRLLKKLFQRDRDKEVIPSGRFSDFFLHTSESEQKEVILEAARRANEDQRKLVERAGL